VWQDAVNVSFGTERVERMMVLTHEKNTKDNVISKHLKSINLVQGYSLHITIFLSNIKVNV